MKEKIVVKKKEELLTEIKKYHGKFKLELLICIEGFAGFTVKDKENENYTEIVFKLENCNGLLDTMNKANILFKELNLQQYLN